MENSLRLWGPGPWGPHAEEGLCAIATGSRASHQRGACQYSALVFARFFPSKSFLVMCFCGARLPGLGSVLLKGNVPEFQGCGR